MPGPISARRSTPRMVSTAEACRRRHGINLGFGRRQAWVLDLGGAAMSARNCDRAAGTPTARHAGPIADVPYTDASVLASGQTLISAADQS